MTKVPPKRRVKAAPMKHGKLKRRVPMEGRPGRFITEDAAVEVPWTSYYQRRHAAGELELAELPRTVAPKRED